MPSDAAREKLRIQCDGCDGWFDEDQTLPFDEMIVCRRCYGTLDQWNPDDDY